MFFCFISFIIVCICNVFIKYAFKQILLLCSNRKLKLQTKKNVYKKKPSFFNLFLLLLLLSLLI